MPTFFVSAKQFGAWLEKHAAAESELVVGFYKRGTGLPSMSWPESVDEALCHGWIDGVRTRIDEKSYKIRFTPRKPTSTWSAINIEKVRVLQSQRRMQESGLKAYAHRREAKSKIYSYEQVKSASLSSTEEAQFRRRKRAWNFFARQPAGYRHLVIWRIVSAKRVETRQARLAKLIEASEKGLRL
jgi:uncharacterized protein YdeI (YjbR/CyaY-like superfamily)